MKLSFVIPAYNEEYYIGPCLDAILAQKREIEIAQKAGKTSNGTRDAEIEIIVANNASTDGTAAVVKKYSGVKLVDEAHKGIVWARRAGYLASTGDLIANIDADTRITPGWTRKVLDAFAADPQLVGISGPFTYYDIPWYMKIWVKIFNGIGYGFYLIIRFVFRVGSLLQGGNFVVRRDALEKIGGYDTNIQFYGEDTDVARRLSKLGNVTFTFALPAFSSGRRLAKEGAFTTGIRYATNILAVIFLKHPHTQDSTDIRFDAKDNPDFHPDNMKREWMLRIITLGTFLILFVGCAYLVYYLAMRTNFLGR